MKKYILIGLFGFFGATARFLIKYVDLSEFSGHFPLNTLAINITGCLLFSLILTLAYETRKLNPDFRLGITAGFFGAYTTFSAFCKDTIVLITNGFYFEAFSYVSLSLLLGLAISWIGAFLAKTIVIRTIRKLRALYFSKNQIGEIET